MDEKSVTELVRIEEQIRFCYDVLILFNGVTVSRGILNILEF